MTGLRRNLREFARCNVLGVKKITQSRWHVKEGEVPSKVWLWPAAESDAIRGQRWMTGNIWKIKGGWDPGNERVYKELPNKLPFYEKQWQTEQAHVPRTG